MLLCGWLTGTALVVDCLDVSGILDDWLAEGDWRGCAMLPGNWLADGVAVVDWMDGVGLLCDWTDCVLVAD